MIIGGIGNPPPPSKPPGPPESSGAKVRRRIRRAVEELRAHRGKADRMREEVALLEAQIERGDYPSFQWEAFRNDDLRARATLLRELDEMEPEERELEQRVRYWLERRRLA